MASFWEVSGTTTVALPAPTGSPFGGLVTRIRAITASCSAAGNLIVSDSALGVLLQLNYAGAGQLIETDFDLRSSVGGNVTISWSAGGATISTQGDYVPLGQAYGTV